MTACTGPATGQTPAVGATTPEQLLGRLQSLQPDPATKAADPAKVQAFADANPEVLLQGRYDARQPALQRRRSQGQG